MPKISTSLLTDKEIKNFKPEDKPYIKSDINGLRILIHPDGRKIWEFVYTSPTLYKKRKSTFGTYPKTTLKEARDKRETYLNLIKQGIDPIDAQREEKAEVKLQKESDFSNVVNLWFQSQESHIVHSTYKKKRALFDTTVIPVLKHKSIAEIKHDELVQIIKIKAIQTPETAKRLLGYFHDLWQFACTHGYCDFNIVPNIHAKSVLPKIVKKHYACITDPSILKQLVNSIYTYGGHISTKNALKFVLHVPLRAGNLVSLKWAYVDFEKHLITIPRKEMKAKSGDDFILPLSDEAIAILQEQYLYTSHKEFVFVADNGLHIDEVTPSRALQRMGFNNETLGNKQRLHSFRATFRSLVDTHQMEHRSSYEAKEKVLDHIVGSGVERAYTQKAIYTEEMRLLLTWWSGYILAMMDSPLKG
ncbi:tyrosine-type recombinase/integrase [Sulfurospirillum deleyianum]|uniref:Integrase family protein n=1 Tax=Sulfurospirillum deleyianum (strain ATCC 51133 / DSM 6946 / 5175) TaxID=525898 RepID=D1AZM1_SULD5|nr:integrase arm-type DNA-binding domain-containing protein [Sulfurospirillum deleyianum]ACZ11488.1 integrase family protein [Sulfurospirillum deleyianum DSM 6946]